MINWLIKTDISIIAGGAGRGENLTAGVDSKGESIISEIILRRESHLLLASGALNVGILSSNVITRQKGLV